MDPKNATHYGTGLAAILFSAQELHKVMTQREMAERSQREASEHELAKLREETIKHLKIPVEITPEKVAAFMTRVHQAAEHGEKQVLVLRFPSDLCSDGGRAINNALAGWEETLVGVPRQIYDVWAEELKPRGFALRAEVLDYPHGMPGDIGLFCRW